MKHRSTLTTLLLLLWALPGLQAQTFHPDYLDGSIYLKLEDTSTVDLDPYNNGIPVLNALITLHGVDTIYAPFRTSDPLLEKIYRMEFSDIMGADLLANALQALGFVDYAEKVPLVMTTGSATYLPNDLQVQQYALTKINAELAWDISRGDTNITVAVVDNAVSLVHEDLVGVRWTNPGEIPGDLLDNDLNGYADDVHGYDVANLDGDPSPPTGISMNDAWNHGSHCAGIVTAETDNGTGIASLGFNLRYIGVKASLNATSGAVMERAYEGVDYAMAAGADIVSMSWGTRGNSITGQTILSVAASRGLILIAAAGNNDDSIPHYPAAYPETFAVGSTNSLDQKSGFSNYGSYVDVMAPGSSIYSTLGSGTSDYASFSGTSMACPLVAGLAGLILSVDPALTPQQVEDVIRNGCDNIDALNPTYVGQLGAGRINAFNSLNALQVSIDPGKDARADRSIYPNPLPAGQMLRLQHGNSANGLQVDIFNSLGQSVARQRFLPSADALSIATQRLSPGIYFISILEDGHKTTQRLVIQ